MNSSRKTFWLALVTAILIVVLAGCNDTLRQFITPVPSPGGDPGTLSHAIVLSTNPAAPSDGTAAVGSDLHIDVSGDTVVGVVSVGPQPLFLGKSTNRVFVLNAGTAGTQTTEAVPATVTSYIGLLPLGATPSTITLPTGTVPQGGGFSNAGNFYLVKSASLDPANTDINNAGVISAGVNAVTTTVPVGTNPVAIAGNNNNNKIYVVNQGSNDVTVVSTTDNFVQKTILVGTSPVWGVMAPDGVHVFIVNQGSNNVSVIDTLLDQVIATIDVGVSPNYAIFEPKNQRVYVSNTGSPFISVIKANGIDLSQQILPTKIADIPIAAPATSVAALPDGTRAYAALGGCPAGTNHTNVIGRIEANQCPGNQVAVINALALTQTKLITVESGAVSIDAANNSARVYVVGANDRNVSIINTAGDTVLTSLPAPQESLGCQSPTKCPQNLAQIPFQVRVFP